MPSKIQKDLESYEKLMRGLYKSTYTADLFKTMRATIDESTTASETLEKLENLKDQVNAGPDDVRKNRVKVLNEVIETFKDTYQDELNTGLQPR